MSTGLKYLWLWLEEEILDVEEHPDPLRWQRNRMDVLVEVQEKVNELIKELDSKTNSPL